MGVKPLFASKIKSQVSNIDSWEVCGPEGINFVDPLQVGIAIQTNPWWGYFLFDCELLKASFQRPPSNQKAHLWWAVCLILADPKGFEPPTNRTGICHSIQLNYGSGLSNIKHSYPVNFKSGAKLIKFNLLLYSVSIPPCN